MMSDIIQQCLQQNKFTLIELVVVSEVSRNFQYAAALDLKKRYFRPYMQCDVVHGSIQRRQSSFSSYTYCSILKEALKIMRGLRTIHSDYEEPGDDPVVHSNCEVEIRHCNQTSGLVGSLGPVILPGREQGYTRQELWDEHNKFFAQLLSYEDIFLMIGAPPKFARMYAACLDLWRVSGGQGIGGALAPLVERAQVLMGPIKEILEFDEEETYDTIHDVVGEVSRRALTRGGCFEFSVIEITTDLSRIVLQNECTGT